jgi:hypothetical protein
MCVPGRRFPLGRDAALGRPAFYIATCKTSFLIVEWCVNAVDTILIYNLQKLRAGAALS